MHCLAEAPPLQADSITRADRVSWRILRQWRYSHTQSPGRTEEKRESQTRKAKKLKSWREQRKDRNLIVASSLTKYKAISGNPFYVNMQSWTGHTAYNSSQLLILRNSACSSKQPDERVKERQPSKEEKRRKEKGGMKNEEWRLWKGIPSDQRSTGTSWLPDQGRWFHLVAHK